MRAPSRVPALLLAACWLASGAAAAAPAPAPAGVIVEGRGAASRACPADRVEWIIGGVAEGPAAPCAAPASGRIASAGDHVGAPTQRVRDDERRAILQDELRQERSRLATLGAPTRREGDEQATQRRRTQDNIEALQRELARLP